MNSDFGNEIEIFRSMMSELGFDEVEITDDETKKRIRSELNDKTQEI